MPTDPHGKSSRHRASTRIGVYKFRGKHPSWAVECELTHSLASFMTGASHFGSIARLHAAMLSCLEKARMKGYSRLGY